MLTSYKLPFTFDVERLNADLNRILPGEWIPHFNTAYYQGDWSGVALRSVGGSTPQLYSDPTAQGKYLNTPILARCLYSQQVLAVFDCPLESVRLLKLAAGSTIREHRDFQLGYDYGSIRLHIPISTKPHIEFMVDGQHIEMGVGECWYIDFGLPHSMHNRGDLDRVHLVIDCLLNDLVRSIIPFEQGFPLQTHDLSANNQAQYMIPEGLEQLRRIVLENLPLQERLRETPDLQSFSKLLLQLGRECHCKFTIEDLEHALRIGRRELFERWI